MIRQRHRGVANARREQFHQPGGDRTIDHGHVDHQDGQQQKHHRVVGLGRIGLLGVAGVLEGGAEGRDEGVVAGLEVGGRHAGAFEAWDDFVADAHLRDGARFGLLVLVGDGPFRQHGLGQVAGAGEFGLADRVELERTLVGIGDHRDRVLLLRNEHVGITVLGQRIEDREVGHRCEDAASHDDALASDAVRQAAENDKKWRTDQQRTGNQQVGCLRVDLERLQQEEQRVELPGVPDDGLAGGTAEQRHDHYLEVLPAGEGFSQRRLGGLAFGLHLQEHRRLAELQADVDRDDQQQDRQQEGNPPAPGLKCFVAADCTAGQDHQERKEQAEGGGGLYPRGEVATLAFGCMFGHVSRCAAILATQGQALQQAQGDQDDRCRHANGRVTGQKAHDGGRDTHDHNGDQEGVLAPDHVAQTAEHDGAEGANGEACGEREQGKDEGRCLVDASKEVLGDNRGKRAVEIEVVPFEHGAQGRGENDLALLLGDPAVGRAARGCVVDCGHESSPSCSCYRPEYPLSYSRTQALGLKSSDYGLRKACTQADGLASLQGF